jgi:cbb3-type cytochrome oxidase subunit 3
MGLILLEALGAGLLFILIIWWTMFSGRNKGELDNEDEAPHDNGSSRQGGPPKA